jgi:hypothetical protein
MRNKQKKSAIDYTGACGRILSQRFGPAVFILAVLLMFTSAASAQLTNADILGTVTDATGAVVPGVNITLTNLGTNEKRTVTAKAVQDLPFHGSVDEFFRNDIFGGRTVFRTNGHKPELCQNPFGGSIGGPIINDRTFFYFDYGGLRLVSGVTYFKTVPTIAEHHDINSPQALMSAANGTADLPIDPIALNYLKLFPTPNTGTPCQLANDFTISPNNSGSQYRPDQISYARLGNKTLSHFFYRTAFAPQTLGTVGTAQRNSLFGPNFRHVDHLVTERTKVQFRAESFNISNTPNFYIGNGSSGASFGNTAFGGVSLTDPNYAPSQYQFAIKAHF